MLKPAPCPACARPRAPPLFRSTLRVSHPLYPKGSPTFINITLDKHFRYGGAVQWDGRDVAVGDYESNAIYQFQIDGTTGTKVGETRLDGSDYAIGFWIDGSHVIGPNDDSTNVMYWNYPAGGTHTKRIGGLHTPWGAVVSLAK